MRTQVGTILIVGSCSHPKQYRAITDRDLTDKRRSTRSLGRHSPCNNIIPTIILTCTTRLRGRGNGGVGSYVILSARRKLTPRRANTYARITRAGIMEMWCKFSPTTG